MFLLVLAYPGCSGPKAVKWLCVCVLSESIMATTGPQITLAVVSILKQKNKDSKEDSQTNLGPVICSLHNFAY